MVMVMSPARHSGKPSLCLPHQAHTTHLPALLSAAPSVHLRHAVATAVPNPPEPARVTSPPNVRPRRGSHSPISSLARPALPRSPSRPSTSAHPQHPAPTFFGLGKLHPPGQAAGHLTPEDRRPTGTPFPLPAQISPSTNYTTHPCAALTGWSVLCNLDKGGNLPDSPAASSALWTGPRTGAGTATPTSERQE